MAKLPAYLHNIANLESIITNGTCLNGTKVKVLNVTTKHELCPNDKIIAVECEYEGYTCKFMLFTKVDGYRHTSPLRAFADFGFRKSRDLKKENEIAAWDEKFDALHTIASKWDAT